ncbi:protein cortex isoform X1 [Nomia melanderi]|uniref:protein cortex isoform X1 n=3 Tax=Nomia melanderi TaxID=2448451 RepID=UPI003FCD790B
MFRRPLFRLQNQENQGIGDINTTPLNSGTSRLPRVLLNKFLMPSDDARYSHTNTETATSKNIAEVIRRYPPPLPEQNSFADRFIIPRKKCNMEAANYLLTRKVDEGSSDNKLDVFKEIKTLNVKWRKEAMHRAIERANIIPGLGQKQVLYNRSASENKLPGILATQPKALWSEGDFRDEMWRSTPRNQPLISQAGSILDILDVQRRSRISRYLIDWSSKDMIAEAIRDKVSIFKSTMPQLGSSLKTMDGADVSSLKWNNAGDRLAVCTLSSTVKLYDGQNNQIVWTATHNQITPFIITNRLSCICWSHDDQLIAVGSATIIRIYSAKTGQVINSIEAHNGIILTITISSNDCYLVSSSADKKISIFKWPKLLHYMDIEYSDPATAVAWHPYDGNLLCIGGGWSDASLSLWNMSTRNVQSYRLVDFFGAVENLAWNKRSGELVVHWAYWENDIEYNVVPVLGSLDRIVDMVPMKKDLQVISLVWNADHTQLGVYTGECFYVWNFFGDEYQYRQSGREQKKTKEMKKRLGVKTLNNIHRFVR